MMSTILREHDDQQGDDEHPEHAAIMRPCDRRQSFPCQLVGCDGAPRHFACVL
jgi:hypothetical protein